MVYVTQTETCRIPPVRVEYADYSEKISVTFGEMTRFVIPMRRSGNTFRWRVNHSKYPLRSCRSNGHPHPPGPGFSPHRRSADRAASAPVVDRNRWCHIRMAKACHRPAAGVSGVSPPPHEGLVQTPTRTGAAGRVRIATRPPPSRASRSTRPPWVSAILAMIDRPRPTPRPGSDRVAVRVLPAR